MTSLWALLKKKFSWFLIVMRHWFRDASGTCACVCVGRGKMLAWDSKEKLKGSLIRTASKSGDRMWHVQLSVECVTMVICVWVFFLLSFSALARGEAINAALSLSPRFGIAIQGSNQCLTHGFFSPLLYLVFDTYAHTQLLFPHRPLHT